MFKKISFLVLVVIFMYLIVPISMILDNLGLYNDKTSEYLIYVNIILYLIAFIDLFFLTKKKCDVRLVKLSMITKLIYLPIFLLLMLFGFLTIIVIMGTGIILITLVAGAFMMFITSLYSSIGIYLYYKNHNMKCKKSLILTQWIFPLDIIFLIIFYVYMKKDKIIGVVKDNFS